MTVKELKRLLACVGDDSTEVILGHHASECIAFVIDSVEIVDLNKHPNSKVIIHPGKETN